MNRHGATDPEFRAEELVNDVSPRPTFVDRERNERGHRQRRQPGDLAERSTDRVALQPDGEGQQSNECSGGDESQLRGVRCLFGHEPFIGTVDHELNVDRQIS